MTTQRDAKTDEGESQKNTGPRTQGVRERSDTGHQTVTGTTRDDLLTIAAVAERRRLIRHLHTSAPCDLGEAVRAVADDPNDSHLVHERLKEDHLPLLEEFGVVEFDGVVIRPGEEFELAVEFVWDLVDSFESLGVDPGYPMAGGEN